jgi:hypothetical protein
MLGCKGDNFLCISELLAVTVRPPFGFARKEMYVGGLIRIGGTIRAPETSVITTPAIVVASSRKLARPR